MNDGHDVGYDGMLDIPDEPIPQHEREEEDDGDDEDSGQSAAA
jgi:hypothetical protein